MRALRVEWIVLALGTLLALGIALRGNAYQQQIVFSTALFVVLAYGWNVISGLTGYLSFGQIAFFGLGAYVAVGLMLFLRLPWYEAAIVAPLAAVCVAIPLGAVMLRLAGVFFTLGMFGLGRLGEIVASSVSGGAMGTSVPSVATPRESATVMIVLALGAIVLTHLLINSKFGLQCMAIRDDQPAARAAGVPVGRIKVLAFALSAALAALGGVMYVWNVGYLDPPSAFSSTTELQVVLMVLVGGIGSMWGPLFGAVLISLIGQVLWARFPLEEQVVLGSITVLMAVALPGGISAMLQARGKLKRVAVWSPPPAAASVVDAPARLSTGAGDEPVLICERLAKHFGGVAAVDGVDLRIARGEVVGIIGPNGAGKSTLFDVITGFAAPSGGRVVFLGNGIGGGRPDAIARRGIARTFQTSRLFATLCVWETVVLAASSVHPTRSGAIAEARRVLAQVGLLEVWSRLPEALPPGQLRLLEIARALALGPDVLLLDEAMAGMTPVEIARVHAALRYAVGRGCAVVAIEHVLPAIATIAERVYVLDFGKVIAEGPPARVFRDPIVLDAYIGVTSGVLDEVAGIGG
jgi:branched-chain amino acid transport system permease protein